MSGDFAVLSAEVREMIWSLVVVPLSARICLVLNDPGHVQMKSRMMFGLPSDLYPSDLSLFFTDEQRSFEARKIFYSKNTLSFPDPACYSYPVYTVETSLRFFRTVSPQALG